MVNGDSVAGEYERRFGRQPRVFRAPGRVNLIGEHTDYNDGFVLPIALDRATWVAVSPRADRRLVLQSTAYAEPSVVELDAPGRGRTKHWSDYVRGVAAVLERGGHRLRGADVLIHTDLPIGSGLSSSAALEVASAYALLETAGMNLGRAALAKACQRAEQEFVGTRCGIMDQFIACHGRPSQALLLDTRHLTCEWLPVPAEVSVVVCNTMVKHDLAAGEYNARRADCEAGVAALQTRLRGVDALRDVTATDLESMRNGLPEQVYRRCRHVIGENGRVHAAAAALRQGRLPEFGRLMMESHRSLRDDYEVSCRELDVMVELASQLPGVYGARMTGGGFGGCTVNLVRTDLADAFEREIRNRYRAATGRQPDVYVCAAAEGVGEARIGTGIDGLGIED